MLEFRAARRAFAIAALIVSAGAHGASAQTYPAQNVTVLVAFAAGGIADVVARLVGAKAQRAARADRGGGKSRRRRRQSGGARGERPRRLTATRILATTSALAVNDTASRNKGYATEDLRTVAHRGDEPGRARRASEQSGQGSARVHRHRQGQELHLRQRRRRHRPAYRRGIFLPRSRQGEVGARAVHRRRAGGHRRDRQPCRRDRA